MTVDDFETKIAPPPEGERCTDVLQDMLLGYEGVHGTELDLHQGKLRVNYDPTLLSDERALLLVKQAGQKAWGRVSHCTAKNDESCASCLARMNIGLGKNLQKLNLLPLAPLTQFNQGVMEIQLAGATIPYHETSQAETSLAAQPTAPQLPKPSLARERVDILLTSLTALATILAFLGNRVGFLSSGWVSALYAVAYLAGGYAGVIAGIKALVQDRQLNVDLLMILAALGAAFIGQPAEGAALLFLFSLSNTLQAFAMDRSRKAIEKLLDLRPSIATVRRGSRLVTLPVEQLVIGDIVIVRPGERFPIDGEVVSGTSTADQASITGESIPVPKQPSDGVYAATLNGNGSLEVRTTRLAQDTTLAKIVNMVEEAQSTKARTQSMLDTFEQFYAMFVLGAAALLIIVPVFGLGHEVNPTMYRAMTWLVVASPCALVISTPASFLSAIANAAKRGVLFKGGIHLERMAEIKVVAFDKTGTLTFGKPILTGVYPFGGVTEEALLRVSASVESRSEHPLASAIVKAAEERGIAVAATTGFQAITGMGVEASLDGHRIWIGSEKMFRERRVHVPAGLDQQVQTLEEKGQTVMLVYSKPSFLGLLAVADTIRPDAADIVRGLKRLGIEKVVMLTGDNGRVAENIARQAGVDEVHAGLLPQDKVRLLNHFKHHIGAIAMVGDGVNDAPALATADLGIAMGGAGTDVALETADVVLMADDLTNLSYAIGLAREARKVVWQNLAFAMAVIVFLVASSFGANLPLPVGVLGHEGSTVIVVLNGLRLLRYQGL